ncbi:2-dehydropantoate 2-reductase [Shewanella sp. SNU WT4]|uniref:ketopantoate reductase family protein n=1 Tax=Shewanella sp. SNU WT4 TaxID=2590015 RepID=UPI00112ECE53|nr:2-dehydropantoate 2-reductase [Shewanella sp. SNU WT4]QDF67908.1 2-dehydropantoate 2-reductase [Shewanella sp. SNU WT4]
MSLAPAHIAIVGPGAIGQLIYHQLNQYQLNRHQLNLHQHKCLLLWPKAQSAIPTQLTFIDRQGVSHHSHHQGLSLANATKAELATIQLVIVTVKAHQVLSAIVPLLPKLAPNCQILLLHNGLGPHLALKAHLSAQPQPLGLLLGTTSQGAMRINDYTIAHTGTGVTQWGQASAPAINAGLPISASLQQGFSSAIPECQWQTDIINALWQKLAVNAAINPLTALHNCRNGELSDARFTGMITAVVTELVQVAAADGVALNYAELLARVYSVIALTANNYSSMQQDMALGRQTEIAAINGYIVARAQAHQLEAPQNQQLLAAILQRQAH